MTKLSIYVVTHFHGGWVSNGYPEETVVAESKDAAKEMVVSKNKSWDVKNTSVKEFKLEGYVIEVYDEKSYSRDKNLKSLDI